jgi:hypothetical protein
MCDLVLVIKVVIKEPVCLLTHDYQVTSILLVENKPMKLIKLVDLLLFNNNSTFPEDTQVCPSLLLCSPG